MAAKSAHGGSQVSTRRLFHDWITAAEQGGNSVAVLVEVLKAAEDEQSKRRQN